ncbi:MAG: response regulator [Holophagaceae bacterium]|nr:response regulator [Holophagaceae bacterium]
MTQPDPPVLDANTLDQLLALDDGGLGLFLEMFELFKEDTPGRIDSMGPLLEAGDLGELADVAHAIKGAASTMGAMRLRVAAAAVEASGRKGEAGTDFQGMLERIRREYAEVIQAMDDFRKSKEG